MWRVEHVTGTVPELMRTEEPPDHERTVRVHTVTRPAVVLGSTQQQDIINYAATDAAGVDVVRRRSGGGVVILWPQRQVWVDFFIPAGDRLWHDDVIRSALWVGEMWVSVVKSCVMHGVGEEPVMHVGGLESDEWGKLVCFAGVGPGEVLLAGRKVVGVSQRRNRNRVRIQTSTRVSTKVSIPTTQNSHQLNEVAFLALPVDRKTRFASILTERVGTLRADASTVLNIMFAALDKVL